jgi:hypothetical protein
MRAYFLTHRALPNSEAQSELSFIESRLTGPSDYLIRLRGDLRGHYDDDSDRRSWQGAFIEAQELENLPARVAASLSVHG